MKPLLAGVALALLSLAAPIGPAPPLRGTVRPPLAGGVRSLPPAATPSALDVRRDPTLGPLRRDTPSLRWEPGHAAFRVEVDGEPVLHRVMAVLALPGREVRVRLPGAPRAAWTFVHAAGAVRTTAGGWDWTAPAEPGVYAGRIDGPGGAAVTLHLLVAHPATRIRDGSLFGYEIGAYARKPLRGMAAYLPPEGFVEVGLRDHDILVSPHFTLGQLLCKQPGEPRFISYSAALVRKLEAVLDAVNEAGIDAPGLHVMSGFRTPAYNRAIGNGTVYSRHLWGDAADIFVDVDGDGDMDDLDGDGRSNLADARVLADIVEKVMARGEDGVRPGGLALYRRNAVHGPFVHVDARGYRARW